VQCRRTSWFPPVWRANGRRAQADVAWDRFKMMIVIHNGKRMTDIILLVKHADTSGRIHRGHVSGGEGGQP